MGFMELFGLAHPEVKRKFYCRIDPDRILDSGFSATEIRADSSYFQIRMSEMFLRDKNEFLRGYIPLTVSVCKFKYAGEKKEVPFFVGNQILDTIGAYVKDEPVEFTNTRMVGPVPYTGDDVALFVGLFRVQVNDLAQKLFGFMEKIVSTFDLSNLTNYLKIADMVSDGLAGLMGLKQIEMRLGRMDTFVGEEGTANRFKNGYLVFINCDENAMEEEQLWVKDGTLMVSDNKKKLQNFRSYDYCLVCVEKLNERPDLDSLPFHQQWNEAVRNIWDGNEEAAKRNYLNLMGLIAASSDITPAHRSILMQAYLANYQKEIEDHRKFANPDYTAESVATRGSSKGRMSARGNIQKAAALSKNARIKEEEKTAVKRSLNIISTNWDRIPHLKERSLQFELTSTALNEQINALAEAQDAPPNPEALVSAITFAAFHEQVSRA
jgi:hypothetical protein